MFLGVTQYFGKPEGRVKIQITSKNIQRYYTLKCLIRDLLSNCFTLLSLPPKIFKESFVQQQIMRQEKIAPKSNGSGDENKPEIHDVMPQSICGNAGNVPVKLYSLCSFDLFNSARGQKTLVSCVFLTHISGLILYYGKIQSVLYFFNTQCLQYNRQIYLCRHFSVQYRCIFLRVTQYFGEPERRIKVQTTSKNIERCYALKFNCFTLLSLLPKIFKESFFQQMH